MSQPALHRIWANWIDHVQEWAGDSAVEVRETKEHFHNDPRRELEEALDEANSAHRAEEVGGRKSRA